MKGGKSYLHQLDEHTFFFRDFGVEEKGQKINGKCLPNPIFSKKALLFLKQPPVVSGLFIRFCVKLTM